MLPLAEAIATLTFIGVGFAVGLRLLWLARRSGGFPERALGLALFLIAGTGYPLRLAGQLQVESAPELARLLLPASGVLLGAGWMAVWLFTWRVFRPDGALARGCAMAAMTGLAGCALVRGVRALLAEDSAALVQPSAEQLGTQLLALAAYAWTGGESFRYHVLLRRRLRLGLADPVVANRFLLWGLVAVFSFASLTGPTLATLTGHEATGLPAVRLCSAVAGLACAALLYLAFLPPRAYLERVQARADALL